ncbi:zinc finger protein [Musa troglodytarum]|uniref:Zinc finger protein n=1 Tax=Musa troglodytarum TaxID=320322 RepID=A0A9E7HSI4_9LILI|nr:zinc finger protein [Musa troglodytarum]
MTTRPPRSPDVCHVINRHVSRNTFATVKRCNGTLPIDRSCRRTSVTFHPFFALLFVGERSPITVAKSFVGDVRRGDAALSFLNIVPPSQEYLESNVDGDSSDKLPRECTLKEVNNNKTSQEQKEFIEFVGPEGEIFVCSADVESGSYFHQDTLINLGCSCKNDLAQSHYACALKWFVSHGSTMCEICGSVAKNVRVTDFRKVMASLKDYEELRNRTVTGEFAYTHVGMNSGVDPDAVAAIRRQRLSEISLWFSPHSNSVTVSQEALEEFPYNPTENVVNMETQTAKWALEGTGILVAIGLVTVILTWFITSRVGKNAPSLALRPLSQNAANPPPRGDSPRRFSNKIQVWTSTLLDNLICILVSCFCNMGLSDPERSINMILPVELEEPILTQILVIMSVLHRLKEPQFLVVQYPGGKDDAKVVRDMICVYNCTVDPDPASRYNRNVVVVHSG